MKTIAGIAIILSCFGLSAKAQNKTFIPPHNFFNIKPFAGADSLKLSFPKTPNLLQQIAPGKLNSGANILSQQLKLLKNAPANAAIVYSNMPVKHLQGSYYLPHTPLAGTNDDMNKPVIVIDPQTR